MSVTSVHAAAWNLLGLEKLLRQWNPNCYITLDSSTRGYTIWGGIAGYWTMVIIPEKTIGKLWEKFMPNADKVTAELVKLVHCVVEKFDNAPWE